jgi:ketosteroid isomerase-like protein
MTMKRMSPAAKPSIAGLALFFAIAAHAAAQAKSPADENALHELLDNYAQSIDTIDPQLADRIWSHDPEVSFIHPRGTEKGFEQILNNFYKDTMGTFSQRELTLESPVVHVYGDSGWSEMTWTFHATVKDGGQRITTTGRETQIYHKEKGVWRIVHVHYSGPPITAKLKGF